MINETLDTGGVTSATERFSRWLEDPALSGEFWQIMCTLPELRVLQRFLGGIHSWHSYLVKYRETLRSYLTVRVHLPLNCTFSESLLHTECC